MKQHLRLLPFEVTSERTNKGRTAMYEEIAEGKFPRLVKTGKRGVAWVEFEIDAWIGRLIAERDATDSGAYEAPVPTQNVPNVLSPISKQPLQRDRQQIETQPSVVCLRAIRNGEVASPQRELVDVYEDHCPKCGEAV